MDLLLESEEPLKSQVHSIVGLQLDSTEGTNLEKNKEAVEEWFVASAHNYKSCFSTITHANVAIYGLYRLWLVP